MEIVLFFCLGGPCFSQIQSYFRRNADRIVAKFKMNIRKDKYSVGSM